MRRSSPSCCSIRRRWWTREPPRRSSPADFGVELARRELPLLARHSRCCSTASRCAIAPGAKIGLVGRSGGGKTTLTRLLLRFSDVERGEILIGGQPIDRVPQAALRKLIGYVPQDPSMFHRSIADNIRVGRPDATDAEVRRAARARARRGVHRCAAGGLRDARRRARREAVGRSAPARGDRARDPEGRADPRPGRGDELARFGERGADPGRAVDAARGPDRHRHRAPAVDGDGGWTS